MIQNQQSGIDSEPETKGSPSLEKKRYDVDDVLFSSMKLKIEN